MPQLFPTPKGKLLAIGGHEQREKGGPDHEQSAEFILQRFVDELRKKDTVVVIPTASEEPDAAAQDYVEVFTNLGIKHVEVLNVQSREQANGGEALDMLDRADGVMFTGATSCGSRPCWGARCYSSASPSATYARPL